LNSRGKGECSEWLNTIVAIVYLNALIAAPGFVQNAWSNVLWGIAVAIVQVDLPATYYRLTFGRLLELHWVVLWRGYYSLA
jgi:hypothetical protein